MSEQKKFGKNGTTTGTRRGQLLELDIHLGPSENWNEIEATFVGLYMLLPYCSKVIANNGKVVTGHGVSPDRIAPDENYYLGEADWVWSSNDSCWTKAVSSS